MNLENEKKDVASASHKIERDLCDESAGSILQELVKKLPPAGNIKRTYECEGNMYYVRFKYDMDVKGERHMVDVRCHLKINSQPNEPTITPDTN